LSASAGGAELRWGCWAALGRLGLGGLGCYGLRVWFSFFFSFSFFKSKSSQTKNKLQTTIEFKPGFESNNQKQCTSMHATVNSYISLII
jgi:hypothetical protein